MSLGDALLAASVPFTYSIRTKEPKAKTLCLTAGCERERYVSPSGKRKSHCAKCANEIEKARIRAKKLEACG